MSNPQEIHNQQRQFFRSYSTLSEDFRRTQLIRLREWIASHEPEIRKALFEDLHKSEAETFITEIAFCFDEIDFALKNLKRWMKPKKVKTSLTYQPSTSWIHPEPLGLVLILGPWNYPFQLIIAPLVAAIAAGNCAVLKPSELAPATSNLLKKLCDEIFEPRFVTTVEGDAALSTSLLALKWDHIFFTGGTQIGRIILEAAAKHLTPVTLELGGKTPCIVDGECDFEVTVRRIIWGKFMNSGQTCVAPDYVLLPAGMRGQFVEQAKLEIEKFFGSDPAKSPDYSRIVSQKHLARLKSLLEGGPQVAVGGVVQSEEKYFSPTLLVDVEWSHPVMQGEIFGPVLPVLEYGTLNEVIELVNSQPKPLALYFFSKSKERTDEVLKKCSFGGGCVNDVLIHLGNPRLPFGGVGPSGMGAYHGETGFRTFSHYKSVVRRNFIFDFAFRYPPYKEKLKLLRRLLG